MKPVQNSNGVMAAGAVPEAPKASGTAIPPKEYQSIQRWSTARKRDVTLRILRGEPMDLLSRELGVEIHRLEKWRDKALRGVETALRERDGDPLQAELDVAMQRIGELTMANELLRRRCNENRPLGSRRSRP